MVIAAGKDGEGDAGERHQHGQPRFPRHGLVEEEPTRDAGSRRREGHEKLPELGAEHDVGVEKTIVAEYVADHAGEQQPAPCGGIRTGGDRRTGHHPKQY